MRNSYKTLSVAMLGIILSVSALALPSAVDQPHMHAALTDLRQAKAFLQRATADKGGHRGRAIDLTEKAIIAVNDGIEYDRTHFNNRRRRNSEGDNIDLSVLLPADQPNMVKAREQLQGAIGNLERASADKGGHRNRAISLAKDAIDAVNAGIEYDRTH